MVLWLPQKNDFILCLNPTLTHILFTIIAKLLLWIYFRLVEHFFTMTMVITSPVIIPILVVLQISQQLVSTIKLLMRTLIPEI